MAGSPATLTEAILAGVGSAVDDIFVARAAKVTAYDPITNTAVVKPMVKRALYVVDDDERVYEELPEIPFVPVIWPRAGSYAVTLPLAVGDTVLLVFCDVSHAEWREGGDVSEPVDARRHSLGWPVAIPGLYPDNSPLSAAALDVAARIAGVVLGQHGGSNRIEISSAGVKLGAMAVIPVAKSVQTVTTIIALQAQFAALAVWVAANTATAWTAVGLIATAPALTTALTTGSTAVPAAATLIASTKTFTE